MVGGTRKPPTLIQRPFANATSAKEMTKLETINGVAPYSPLARSLAKVARSSMIAGTYATAMKDMNAEPKNCRYSVSMGQMYSRGETHDGVHKRLDIILRGVKADPDCSHHDGKPEIHQDADTVGNHVTITLDK